MLWLIYSNDQSGTGIAPSVVKAETKLEAMKTYASKNPSMWVSEDDDLPEEINVCVGETRNEKISSFFGGNVDMKHFFETYVDDSTRVEQVKILE